MPPGRRGWKMRSGSESGSAGGGCTGSASSDGRRVTGEENGEDDYRRRRARPVLRYYAHEINDRKGGKADKDHDPERLGCNGSDRRHNLLARYHPAFWCFGASAPPARAPRRRSRSDLSPLAASSSRHSNPSPSSHRTCLILAPLGHADTVAIVLTSLRLSLNKPHSMQS